METRSALIGVESKRFEPYREKRPPSLSDAYWRPVWGRNMRGYESVRDSLKSEPGLYRCLDAAQLFKHAFALRTEVHRRRAFRPPAPVLFYIHAEPERWPDGRPVDRGAASLHRAEIARFREAVAGDEVAFVPCSWRRLLADWEEHDSLRDHARAVAARFSP